MVSKEELRSGMAKFATGVTVVTTLDHQGVLHGMTANSFTSISLAPPLVLISVDFRSHTHEFVKAQGAFGVNILNEEQQEIGAYFARRPEDRKGKTPYRHHMSEKGIPVIEDSMAFFGCHVVDAHVHGDHTIYVAQVEDISVGTAAKPLLYYRSRFTHLGQDAA